MEHLTITHIQHYLAYGLKVQFTDSNYKKHHGIDVPTIGRLLGLNIYDQSDSVMASVHSENGVRHGLLLSEIKPLLLPLSALYEEIDGEIGIVEIAKILSGTILVDKIEGACRNLAYFRCTFEDGIEELIINQRCEGWYRSYFDKNQPSTGRNVINQFEVFNYLFQHHYDIFGLIDKGLAIDLNKNK